VSVPSWAILLYARFVQTLEKFRESLEFQCTQTVDTKQGDRSSVLLWCYSFSHTCDNSEVVDSRWKLVSRNLECYPAWNLLIFIYEKSSKTVLRCLYEPCVLHSVYCIVLMYCTIALPCRRYLIRVRIIRVERTFKQLDHSLPQCFFTLCPLDLGLFVVALFNFGSLVEEIFSSCNAECENWGSPICRALMQFN